MYSVLKLLYLFKIKKNLSVFRKNQPPGNDSQKSCKILSIKNKKKKIRNTSLITIAGYSYLEIGQSLGNKTRNLPISEYRYSKIGKFPCNNTRKSGYC